MGILDRLRGMGEQRPPPSAGSQTSADDHAIARYRYLLRTAPPETIEQAHAEAFAQLTPEQRRRVLQELSASMSPGERMAAARAAEDPGMLAQMATRAEIRQPGAIERALGGVGGASALGSPGLGGMMAGSFFASMAGTVLGSMIAQQFLGSHGDAGHPFGGLPSQDAPSADTTVPIEDPFKHSVDRGEDYASRDDGDTSDGDFGAGDDSDFGGDFGGDSFDV
jgi:hypothetical protein